jgi:hypothetical protein
MRMCSSRGVWALVLAAGVMSCLPGKSLAHPHLVGRWVAEAPPGGSMVYDFGPGEYVGNWVWRGPFTFSVANCPVATGTYQLLMFNGVEGTLSLRDGNEISTGVANVDLGRRSMTFKNVIFHP